MFDLPSQGDYFSKLLPEAQKTNFCKRNLETRITATESESHHDGHLNSSITPHFEFSNDLSKTSISKLAPHALFQWIQVNSITLGRLKRIPQWVKKVSGSGAGNRPGRCTCTEKQHHLRFKLGSLLQSQTTFPVYFQTETFRKEKHVLQFILFQTKIQYCMRVGLSAGWNSAMYLMYLGDFIKKINK